MKNIAVHLRVDLNHSFKRYIATFVKVFNIYIKTKKN